MKILLLILALPAVALAQLDDPAWLATATKPAVAGGTPVLKDSQANHGSFTLFGSSAASTGESSSWLAGSSYSLTSIKIWLCPQETAGGTLLCRIYNTSTEVPDGAAISSDSESIAINGLTTYPGGLSEFTFASPVSISSGTTYAMAIIHSTPDGAHRAIVFYDAKAGRTLSTFNGSAWSAHVAGNQFCFEAYGY